MLKHRLSPATMFIFLLAVYMCAYILTQDQRFTQALTVVNAASNENNAHQVFGSISDVQAYRAANSHIPLTVHLPAKDTQLSDRLYQLEGKTIPDAQVLVNGEEVQVDRDGTFRVGSQLTEGENMISVFAQGADERYAYTRYKIVYHDVQ